MCNKLKEKHSTLVFLFACTEITCEVDMHKITNRLFIVIVVKNTSRYFLTFKSYTSIDIS